MRGAPLAVAEVIDPGDARSGKRDLRHQRAGLDRKVWTAECRAQVCDSSAAPTAIADRRLPAAETLLLCAVVIVSPWMPGSLARCGKGFDERVFVARPRCRQRSVTAAIFVSTALPAFLAEEIGQHMRIGPVRQARFGPAVVIAAMAAHIGHRVNRRRTSG